ncbi:TetR/AcrR family transcriptional regulator [Rhodococcus sp. HNM0569]|uniref:TetR/AcrR family transcriptional regulator n=1 Tax=Rhodococcus sp. HNM0569 TaxID=2716340 RepID=UPI00146D4BFD|nr:TetR/AcrR family transcriptional regulator [Rhodococcus sp. HNM0569]NLU82206.1 helix-turn-helix transcriptional regulator [Rhodococcus sp. HNM0569]
MSTDAAPPARRRNAAATRQALLDAARTLIADHGAAATSTRDIAAAAGVNQALINRYFGSKENLFVEAVRVGDPGVSDAIESTPLDDVPNEVLRLVLEISTTGRSTVGMLTGVVNNETMSSVVKDMVETIFTSRLAARLDGPDAALRAELLNAVVVGIALMREKIGSPAIADADVDTLADYVTRMCAPLLADS